MGEPNFGLFAMVDHERKQVEELPWWYVLYKVRGTQVLRCETCTGKQHAKQRAEEIFTEGDVVWAKSINARVQSAWGPLDDPKARPVAPSTTKDIFEDTDGI